MIKIAITTGDPAGIGPEITSKAIRFLKLRKNIIFIVYALFILAYLVKYNGELDPLFSFSLLNSLML